MLKKIIIAVLVALFVFVWIALDSLTIMLIG